MLTRRQLEAYHAIQEHFDLHEVAPTYQELADTLHLKSKSNIYVIIKALEDRGVLERLPGRKQAMRLLPLVPE